jgi:hypothetical protein
MPYGMTFPPDFIPRGSSPAMSNAERQRQFRKRNPDYYRLLHAKRRAASKARFAEYMAAQAQVQAVRREPLMLPAPVEEILIPGMNAIPTSMPVREAVEITLSIPPSATTHSHTDVG